MLSYDTHAVRCTASSFSLHFGWVSCASLVNFNNYIATLAYSDKKKLNFSLASVVAAVGLGVAVTGSTGDPVYAGVVAWALSAVASEKGWGRMKVIFFVVVHVFSSVVVCLLCCRSLSFAVRLLATVLKKRKV